MANCCELCCNSSISLTFVQTVVSGIAGMSCPPNSAKRVAPSLGKTRMKVSGVVPSVASAWVPMQPIPSAIAGSPRLTYIHCQQHCQCRCGSVPLTGSVSLGQALGNHCSDTRRGRVPTLEPMSPGVLQTSAGEGMSPCNTGIWQLPGCAVGVVVGASAVMRSRSDTAE